MGELRREKGRKNHQNANAFVYPFLGGRSRGELLKAKD